MARPIEPTPALNEEESEKLLAELACSVDPQALAQRRERASNWLDQIMRPKGSQHPTLSTVSAEEVAEQAVG